MNKERGQMVPVMPRRSPPPVSPPVEAELTIGSLGVLGDGVALLDGRPVYVALTVPGDRARVRLGDRRGDGIEGWPLELLCAGPERAEPPCRHFGACGGCRLQHLSDTLYRRWKTDLVRHAFDRRGLGKVVVAPLVVLPPGTRRRATLAARRSNRGVFLGFNEHRGHRIADLGACTVLRPELVALLPELRAVLGEVLAESEPADIAVALLDDGIDLVVIAGRDPDLDARERLAAFAERADLARISWRSDRGAVEPIAHRRPGVVRFGGVAVTLPPGSFLQASREGEAVLVERVCAGIGAAARVADLFCGAGTFALPLATGVSAGGPAVRGVVVEAFDQNADAVAALDRAARRAGQGNRLRTAMRDLMRDPLTPRELNRFDAVVLDPPRQGARAQAAALAQSVVPVVVMVSCDPASFSRDAALLIEGGYRLDTVTPIDQFLWSSHLELVAVLRRP